MYPTSYSWSDAVFRVILGILSSDGRKGKKREQKRSEVSHLCTEVTKMKALTIRQPWASLIVLGHKDVENRTWKTAIRGQITIHSGQSKSIADWHSAIETVAVVRRCSHMVAETWLRENIGCFEDLPRGQVLGTVHMDFCSQKATSLWHFPRYWGFYLSNPIVFDVPIPQKGRLGFWEVELES